MTAGQAVGVGGVICPAQYIEGGGGGGAVSSVFGRSGTVVAATGDYTYTQVGADQAGAAAAVLATVVAGYAPLASPALTGTPTAPTGTPGDTSTQLATDAFVAAAVSAAVQGLAVKPSVQEATTTALPANTYSNGASGVGATLTAVLPGVLTVDGVAVTLGSRVLVQDEVAAANNGIYVMTTLGTVSVAYVLTRAADMNQAAEVPGAFVFTEAGTVNGGAGFTVSGAGPYTIGTTAINWTQFSGAGEITAGTGLVKAGNVISLATPVAIADGGTGQATAAAAFNALNPNAAPVNLKVATPTGTASTTLVMLGCGSTCTYTPASSGLVLVSVTAYGYCTTASTGIEVGGRYGTGTAPANGVAVSGTRFGASAESYVRPSAATNTNSEAIAFTDIITLTPGTAYWFDLAFATTNASDLCTIYNVSMSFVELAA